MGHTVHEITLNILSGSTRAGEITELTSNYFATQVRVCLPDCDLTQTN